MQYLYCRTRLVDYICSPKISVRLRISVARIRERLPNVTLETKRIMYAIVEIGGQQFKVETGRKLYINLVQAAEGDLLSFDRVLLLEKEGDIKVGTPTVDGASIKAKVLGEVKGDKVIVFKKKRRKTYRKKNGHRQRYTQVLIEEIVA